MQTFTPLPVHTTRLDRLSAPARKLLATTADLWMVNTQSLKIQPAASLCRPATNHKTFERMGLLRQHNTQETGSSRLVA
jgi:hypothetical protein